MRFVLLVVALMLGLAGPASSQTREGYIAADDGARLYYRIEGSGPQTLVVVHGGPGNSLESVRPDFERLARGRTVIYYDQRGNGRSDLIEDEPRLAIDRHIADLEALRRHFRLEKMVLLGNSWGGLLASAYAAAHPDRIERLILDASAPPSQPQLVELGETIARRARQRLTDEERRRLDYVAQPQNWMSDADPLQVCRDFMHSIFRTYTFDPERLPAYRGDVCAGPIEAVRRQQLVNNAIWRSLGAFDLRPEVRHVTAPVLVIHGIADAIPVEGARDWAASYPNARLLLAPRSGHLIHLEQPDLFFEAVEAFLGGEWPEGAERSANFDDNRSGDFALRHCAGDAGSGAHIVRASPRRRSLLS